MSTTAKAFLLVLTTIIVLLSNRLWYSPYCFYKTDYSGGYAFCVSLFKELPPMCSKKTLEFSGSYNSFNNQKKLTFPPFISEKDVVELSEDNFSHIVAKNRYVMVNFYAPRSYWTEKLAPEYAAAATELKGKVVLAKIDAIKEIEFAKKCGIAAYPTIYFFVGGVHVETYYYDRKRDAIVNWIKTKIAGAIYTLKTTDQTQQILMTESTVVLGLLDSLEGLETEELAAKSKLHSDVKFFRTGNADIAEMFQIDPEVKRPPLILLEKEAKHRSHLDGPFTKSAIGGFVSGNKNPLVIRFTRKNAPLILNSPLKQLWLFALKHDYVVKSMFIEAATAFKGKLLFVYVHMDCQNVGRRISDFFGIIGHDPTVIAVTDILNPQNKYVLNGELNISTIKSFALNFMEDHQSNTNFQYRS